MSSVPSWKYLLSISARGSMVSMYLSTEGRPRQYLSLATSTRRLFLCHESSLNGPVPTGWRAKAAPRRFTAAGETMAAQSTVSEARKGKKGSERMNCTWLGPALRTSFR